MLESFLQEGSCTIAEYKSRAQYGKSITDLCMSWDMSEEAIEEAAKLFLK